MRQDNKGIGGKSRDNVCAMGGKHRNMEGEVAKTFGNNKYSVFQSERLTRQYKKEPERGVKYGLIFFNSNKENI